MHANIDETGEAQIRKIHKDASGQIRLQSADWLSFVELIATIHVDIPIPSVEKTG